MTTTSAGGSLFDMGTLVDLDIGMPTFQRKLRSKDLRLTGINQDAIHLGHKKLLPKKATEKLVTISGKARLFLDHRSAEFPLASARFVSNHALAEVLQRLEEFKREWEVEVSQLVDSYPVFREEQLKVLRRQNEELVKSELEGLTEEEQALKRNGIETWLAEQDRINRNLYPGDHEIRGVFNFGWKMFRISSIGNADALPFVSAEDVQKARDQMKATLDAWVSETTTEMHRIIGEAAANAHRMLRENGKLQARNLRPLFEAMEQFKAMDFTGQSNFRQTVERIQSMFVQRNGQIDFDQSADSLNQSTTARTNMRELLNQVGELAVESVAEQAGIAALHRVPDMRRMVDI